MIQQIRIDDRLLHGQVAYSWKAELGYQAVVIASDQVSEDKLRVQALKMAKPQGVKLAVRSIEDAQKMLNDPRMEVVKVLVIVESPEDALALYPGLKEQPLITLGGIQMKEGRDFFAPAVYLSQNAMQALDTLVEMGVDIQVKQVPNEKTKYYTELKQQ